MPKSFRFSGTEHTAGTCTRCRTIVGEWQITAVDLAPPPAYLRAPARCPVV